MAQAKKSNKKNASGLKLALTVASVAATLGAWAEFSSQDVNLAQAAQQPPAPATNQSTAGDPSNGLGNSTTTTPRRGKFGNYPSSGFGQSSDGTGSSSDLNGQSQSDTLPVPITRSQSSR